MRTPVKKEWKKAIITSEIVADVARAILATEADHDQDKEHVWVFGLNGSHVIKYIDLVHLGTANSCPMHPRECYRLAVMKSVTAIVIVHSHPSGDPSPSTDDRTVTRRMVLAGEVLGIKVLDHVVVGKGSCWSFAEHGML